MKTSEKEKKLTHARLTEVLSYDPLSGNFVRRIYVWGPYQAGDKVGSKHSAGYLECTIDGERYYLHRLAWFYMHRQWPKGVIDHINRDKTDNRISNLRDVSTQGNINNSPVKSTNKTGVKGVHVCKRSKKYIAQITVDYKCIHLGTFDTIEGAIEARRLAEARISELIYGPADDSVNKHLEVDKQRIAPHRKKTSSFKGVAKHHTGKWSANIMINKQKKWLGLFDSEEEAGMAYQRYKEGFKGGANG